MQHHALALFVAFIVAITAIVMLSMGLARPRVAAEPVDKPAAVADEVLKNVTSYRNKPVQAVTTPTGQATKAVSGEVLIKLASPPTASSFGEVTATAAPNIFKLRVEGDVVQAAAALRSQPGVLATSPNYLVTKSVTPNDSLYGSYQWNLPKISAPTAWDQTTGNANVVIANLDTGVNHNHQDLSSRIWTDTGEIPGNGLDDDSNGYADDYRGMDFVNNSYSGGVFYNSSQGAVDDEGHGSLTASVTGAASNNNTGVAGVDWQAKVMPVKVLDTHGVGSLSDVANGIRYAAANGAKVASLSLGAFGLTSDFATDDAIDYAITRGMIVVAASGNDGSAGTVSYPARNSNVIAVGATDPNDARASYSNGGAQLSLVAPGTGIPAARAVMDYPNNPSITVQAGSSLAAGAYRYSITAYNANGETIPSQPPNANANANLATVNGNQQVSMAWGTVSGATGYRVYRTPAGGAEGSQKQLIDVGNTTSYLDNGNTALSNTSPPSVNQALINASYMTASGTSLATPHVSGVVGLLAGLKPSLTPSEARTLLQDSADKPSGMNGQNRTDLYGYGRLNATRALSNLAVYSAAYAGQSSYTSPFAGDEIAMYVDYTNTGTTTWKSDGPNPLRLGTSHPRDRVSPFRHSSWLAGNRIGTFSGKVSGGSVTSQTTIAPGETARFEFTMKAPGVGQTTELREYVQPVVEGVSWLEDYGVMWNFTVRPLTEKFKAAWAGQSSYAAAASGDQITMHVDYTNTGEGAWQNNGATPVRLGIAQPLDRQSRFYSGSWLNPSRIGSFTNKVETNGSLTPTSVINPGETARFSFTATAPPVGAATSIREHVRPLAEGVTWMPDQGVFWDINVTPKTYSFNYAGQTGPRTLTLGQRAAATVDLTNTGTATWHRNSLNAMRLGTSHPRDRISGFANNTWMTANRVASFTGKVAGGSLTPQETIAPGETARFQYDLVAPSQPGAYREYWQPLIEGYAWLNDVGMHHEIFVPDPNAPDYDYQYVGQSADAVFARNTETTMKLQIRNIGKQSWSSSGSNPVRLGTERPKDRGSGFNSGDWLGVNRIALTRNLSDGTQNGGSITIPPGDVAEFEFQATANPPSGTYREHFTPMTEGIGWMRDIGISWSFTVVQPISVGLAQQASFSGWSNGAVTLRNEAGQVNGVAVANTALTTGYSGNYYATANSATAWSSSPIHIEQTPSAIFTINDLADNASQNQFRGELYVKNGSVGAWAVNKIDVESYLKAMGEVPDSWPLEAIKAQTVAARTYAARKLASPKNDVFMLNDDTRDQVYNGYRSESAKPNHGPAVDQTKGVAIYHSGQLIQAFYSSDTGGASGANEDIWGGTPIPYLRAVADPFEKPDVWSKTVANATLQANFGIPGNIDGISFIEQYPSGRPKTIRFNAGGQNHDRTHPADTHRNKFTTRSSRITSLGRSGNDWVINGRGFGHGIGMGQWGAYNQANQGRNYQQILQFYYTGVNFGSIY